MSLLDFLSKIDISKLVTVCFFSVIAITQIIYLALKIIKEFSLKIGNVAISMKNTEQKRDVAALVFEYGDFQDQMNDTRDLAINTLHTQVKRFSKLQLMQYLQRLKSEYTKYLEPLDTESKRITNIIFSMFLSELKTSMFSYIMEIYEKNHIAYKTDAELHLIAHDHFIKLCDLFQSHATAIWSTSMEPYEGVHIVSEKISSFSENLVYELVNFYRNQSETRLKILDISRRITNGIKEKVYKDLKMPDNAMTVAENFYTESGGLDKELIKDYIQED